ncbi:uncharacterized protein LOC116124953 [Pistacia vera]|uniref:uncharacterized protein LOC116124953 n=1 Tax=Pistacia vera TaxID=55513 RepID=UPI00126351B3|nr:uncharacterized protein LOC116124953 [Pistacia vera]
MVSRNFIFDEQAIWSWANDNEVKAESSSNPGTNVLSENDSYSNDEEITLATTIRSLEDIYSRCNMASLEPTSFDEVVSNEESNTTMKNEMEMINKNSTWSLFEKLENHKVISVKWIYRTKFNPGGNINKLKARLVVKGYLQQYHIDFTNTFAPITRYDTIRLLVTLSAKLG